jgi:hypothetical protein
MSTKSLRREAAIHVNDYSEVRFNRPPGQPLGPDSRVRLFVGETRRLVYRRPASLHRFLVSLVGDEACRPGSQSITWKAPSYAPTRLSSQEESPCK